MAFEANLQPPPHDDAVPDLLEFLDDPANASRTEAGARTEDTAEARPRGTHGRPVPAGSPADALRGQGPAGTWVPPFLNLPARGQQAQLEQYTTWVCRICHSTDYRWDRMADNWFCAYCGSGELYDAGQPAREETDLGTWTYVPHAAGSPSSSSPRSSVASSTSTWSRPARVQGSRRAPRPDPPSDGPDADERAESETLTIDPTVTPSGASDAGMVQPRLSRRQRRAQRAEEEKRNQQDRAAESPLSETDALRELAKKKGASSENSWSSAKGPEKGVRWRGGTPPAPPKWNYAKDDLRAFTKFERKVALWQLQVRPYMSPAEAALALYTSLGGEAEEELEHIDVKKLYSKNGIEFLLEQLRGPLQAKQIYLKRKYLSDYEVISRNVGESMRNYVNRYHRAEKALLSIGIDVGLTYDAESRGSRLLDRAKLSHEQQRMILVGTAQSLVFEDVKNALVLQYPEHKPVPFLQGQGGQAGSDRAKNGPKGDSKGSKGKGNGFNPSARFSSGGTPYRRAYVAENEDGQAEDDEEFHDALQAIHEDEGEDQDDDQAEQPGDDDDELVPDHGNDPSEAIEELMQVLTVTSKKLQSMTQGRKYRGAPKRSIADRKKTSACSACGAIGHWSGDPECPVSSKGKSKGDDNKGGKAASSAGLSERKGGNGMQKVFAVRHAAGHETLYSLDALPASDSAGQPSSSSRVHRTLAVFQAEFACMANVTELQGYCVVDTACQRSCCSRQWSECQRELIESFGLDMLFANRNEAFQFGAGAPQRSGVCAYFPAAFDASYPMIALSASILENLTIPFLASLSLFKKLNVVLDLAQQKAYIGLLGCTVDLHLLQGHLCLKISEYPACVGSFSWDALEYHDCEFLCESSLVEPNMSPTTSTFARNPASPQPSRDALDPSVMACELAKDPHPYEEAGGSSRCVGLPRGQAGGPQQGDKDHPGCQAGGPQQAKTEARDASCSSTLPPRRHQEARKRSGEIRNMQQVPMQMEVGRGWRSPWLALSSIFQILCASFALGPDGAGHIMDPGFVINGPPRGTAEDATTADFGDFGTRIPWDFGGLDRGGTGGNERGRVRLGGGDGCLSRAGQPGQPKKGAMKRLVHNVARSLQLLDQEAAVYSERKGDYEIHSGADLLEVFWEDRFAKASMNYNLAGQAGNFDLSFVDIDGGTLLQNIEVLNNVCVQVKPYVLMVHNMQRQSATVKRAVQKCCEVQAAGNRLFIVDFDNKVHEDPTGAMENITNIDGTTEVIFKDSSDGDSEAITFVTNSRCLAQSVRKRHRDEDAATTILGAIRAEVLLQWPWRFDVQPHEVWYAPPLDEPEKWMELLESAEKRLGKSKYFYLTVASKEMGMLKQLVPWEITKAQVYCKPMTRRVPVDVPFTHRGAALITNGGKLQLESEDISEIRQPRLKFDVPVRIAIFFYGMAEDDKEMKPAHDDPRAHVPGLRTDVSFPGVPDSIPKEVRAAVARLHCNAGHPPKQETIRLLAAHGSINSAVLTALDHLKCGTCERARMPLKPRPASVPEFVGQFAEQLQADVFYVRDLSATNHPVLGVTCLATKFYQAALLPSRDPQVVLNEFDRLWLRPFGYPLFMSVDADGAFEGAFQQHLQESGTVFTVVPADGHHQIGAIERKNAVFRSVLEKLIDQNAVYNKEQLDLCLSAAIWSVNSSIHTRGRSSMQAVFGKLPRFPGDLFSDSAALATSDYHMLTEHLRTQACQAVNEMSASSIIRRALLRKTATSRARVDELLPGSLVAYWRWNLKARGRKRGGYILGRLVVKDEKNAWVQSGGSLVQVTHEQLRPAIGIETWTPSPEDIRLLKKGDKLLKDGLWDDGRESGPPAEEPLEPAVHDPQAASAGSDDIVVGPLRDDGAEEQRYQLLVLSREAAGEAQPLPLQQQDALTLPSAAATQGREPLEQPSQNIHVFSPRYQQQNIWQYGDGPEARPGRARSRSRGQAQIAPLTPQILPPTPSQPSTPRPPQTPRRRASLRQGQLADRGGGALQTSAPGTPKEPEPSRLPPVPSPLPQTPVPSDFPFSPQVPFSADVLGSAEYGSAEYGAPLEDEPTDNAADTTQAASVEPSGPKATTPPGSSRLADDGPVPQLPAKRPHDALQALKKKQSKKKATAAHSVLLSHFVLDELYEIYRLEDGWDGSPDYRLHSPCTAFRCCAAKVEDTEVSSDSSDSSDDDGASHSSGLSRQERKAIDREIPWRTLMKEYPSDVISLYVKANRKEYDSWMSWNSIKALSKEEARRVLSDPILRKRVMPSRNAYRDKNRGAGPEVRAKCRTVIQGCHDPDLGLLDRSSPTPTRIAELLLYEIACAGYNRRFLKNKKAWKLWSGDVATAFLQGQPEERDLPIYMRPPRDGIQGLAGTFPFDLYQIVGNLYGLCNAPRTWINHIVRKLQAANFIRHRLDHTVYYKLDSQGELLVVLLFHVDDFLTAFREDYEFSELQGMFTWGQTNLLDDGDFVFKGKEVSLKKVNGEYEIHVTQKAFINELVAGKLKRGRASETTPLTPEEMKEYRSCAGSLQWLAGSTRPDIAATVSLSNHGVNSNPSQLKVLYECIDYVKETPDHGLVFRGVAVNFATVVVGYADSSWANAPGGKSQMGVIIVITGPECQDQVSRATILDWRSSRSPRVTRSTLASEANAMDDGVDRATFLNVFLSEFLKRPNNSGQLEKGVLKQLQVTDCKSFFDAVICENPSLEEKRTLISIRSIQDYISPSQVHWVPSELMFADVLTKHSTTLRDEFLLWMGKPHVQLKEDEHQKKVFTSVNFSLVAP